MSGSTLNGPDKADGAAALIAAFSGAALDQANPARGAALGLLLGIAAWLARSALPPSGGEPVRIPVRADDEDHLNPPGRG